MALGTPTVLLQGAISDNAATAQFTPSPDALLLLFVRRFHSPAGATTVTGQADGNGWTELEDRADGAATGSERPISIHAARSAASPVAGSITVDMPVTDAEFFLVEVPITGGGAWTAAGLRDQSDWQTGYAGGAIPDFATTPDSMTFAAMYCHGGDSPTDISDTQLGTYILSNYGERAFGLSYSAAGNDTPTMTVASNIVWSAAILEISDPAGAVPTVNNINTNNRIAQGSSGNQVNTSNYPASITSFVSLRVGSTAGVGGTPMTNLDWNGGQPRFSAPADLTIGTTFEVAIEIIE